MLFINLNKKILIIRKNRTLAIFPVVQEKMKEKYAGFAVERQLIFTISRY